MPDDDPSPAVVKGQLIVCLPSLGQMGIILVRTKGVPRVAA